MQGRVHSFSLMVSLRIKASLQLFNLALGWADILRFLPQTRSSKPLVASLNANSTPLKRISVAIPAIIRGSACPGKEPGISEVHSLEYICRSCSPDKKVLYQESYKIVVCMAIVCNLYLICFICVEFQSA